MLTDTNFTPADYIYSVEICISLILILDAFMTKADDNRLKYVFKGPPKDTGKRLYYIYGTHISDKDKGFNLDEYKPQGKGFSWPQSYRKANNLYYDVIFVNTGISYFLYLYVTYVCHDVTRVCVRAVKVSFS